MKPFKRICPSVNVHKNEPRLEPGGKGTVSSCGTAPAACIIEIMKGFFVLSFFLSFALLKSVRLNVCAFVSVHSDMCKHENTKTHAHTALLRPRAQLWCINYCFKRLSLAFMIVSIRSHYASGLGYSAACRTQKPETFKAFISQRPHTERLALAQSVWPL